MRAQVVATGGHDDEFRRWVSFELDGYPASEAIPAYRRISRILVGNFANIAWKRNRVIVPVEALPPDFRNAADEFQVRGSVSYIEEMASSSTDVIALVLPAGIENLVEYYEDLTCISLWAEVSRTSYREILAAIRRRVLKYAIETQPRAPLGEQASGGGNEEPTPPLISPIATLSQWFMRVASHTAERIIVGVVSAVVIAVLLLWLGSLAGLRFR